MRLDLLVKKRMVMKTAADQLRPNSRIRFEDRRFWHVAGVNMVISRDSSPPLVRLRVVRRSLRKLHPILKIPLSGLGCGDGCLYPSPLLGK